MRNQKGIGLIETLLALGIGIIIITALVSLAIFTLRSSLQNKLLLSGTQHANQEIELVRAYRDSNAWQDFIDDANAQNCFTSSCYMDSGASSLAITSGEKILDAGTLEEIRKSFTLTSLDSPNDTLIKVNVKVTWRIGSEDKATYNYTELSNWRQN